MNAAEHLNKLIEFYEAVLADSVSERDKESAKRALVKLGDFLEILETHSKKLKGLLEGLPPTPPVGQGGPFTVPFLKDLQKENIDTISLYLEVQTGCSPRPVFPLKTIK
jgi:hypothetical protein